MSSSIFARADALMQRRRQTSSELDDVPVLIDAIDPESEIPVLLDIDLPVATLQARDEPEAAREQVASVTVDGEILGDVAHELARRVHERLAAELPKIVEATIRDILAEPDIRALLGRRD
ncbi:MAG: hypothetical protein WCA83_08515 [Azonexus sp.]